MRKLIDRATPVVLAVMLAASLNGCKSGDQEETIQWTKEAGQVETVSPDGADSVDGGPLSGGGGQGAEDGMGGSSEAAGGSGADAGSGVDGSSGVNGNSGANGGSGADSSFGAGGGSGQNSDAQQDYILPDSSTSYLTADDVSYLTPDQFRLARNEIYARHGRKFSAQDLQSYFDSKSWYQGTIEPSAFNESVLNDCEKANIRLLQSMETTAGQSDLPEAPSKKVIDRYGYTYGYSDLSFNITPGTAKDCGSYYLVDAVYNQGIQAPGDLKPGDTVTLVFNELTGETRTLAYGNYGLYDTAYGDVNSVTYYYSPSVDGSPVTLYQDSDDRVEKPIYRGSLYIRKDATVEVAISNTSEPVTLTLLQGDFNWYNGVYFDQKGYVTRLVFIGD